jgi:hypothetical protein
MEFDKEKRSLKSSKSLMLGTSKTLANRFETISFGSMVLCRPMVTSKLSVRGSPYRTQESLIDFVSSTRKVLA